MKKLVILALVATVGAGSAQVLPNSVWYGGDPNGNDAIASERNTSISDAIVLDDFTVSTDTVVTGLYGNFLSDMTAPQGFDYEIRTGVSQGNGGNVVATGTAVSGTWTKNGIDGFGYTGYQGVISGLNINLTANTTYWLGIRIVGSGSNRAFIWQTSGTNGVGKPLNNGNSFINSGFFGFNYEPLDNVFGAPSDYSYGVQAVPEPASMLALAGALGALAARRRRRS